MRLLRENKINWFDKRSGRYLTKELVLQLMMSNNQYYILFCLFVSPYSRVTFYFLWIIWIFFLRSLSPVKLYKRKKKHDFFWKHLFFYHLSYSTFKVLFSYYFTWTINMRCQSPVTMKFTFPLFILTKSSILG